VLNVTYSAQDTACLGAAILAGKAAGVFESIEAAVDSMVKIKKCYEPNMENHAIYKKAYEKYKLLFKSLEPLFAMEGQD
jgi:xylulokinase